MKKRIGRVISQEVTTKSHEVFLLHNVAVITLLLCACLTIDIANAEHNSNTPSTKNKDYRATSIGKLSAAKSYVDKFLTQDADPSQVFWIRQIGFPVWEDQPIRDCDAIGLVRWIETREPYFESNKQDVVVVPVWAELLMVEVGGYDWGWGRDASEDGKSWCKWEYERYNHEKHQFERLPQFRLRTYSEEFAEWGESIQRYSPPYQVEHEVISSRVVAVAPENRVVRYFVRVSVKREQPYRLMPQVPRHWMAKDAIPRLEQVNRMIKAHLVAGVSTRDPSAKGEELSQDLETMTHHIEYNAWMIGKIKEALFQNSNPPDYLAEKLPTNTPDTH